MRRCIATGITLALALWTAECTGARTPSTRTLAVALFGDSLAVQAAPDFDRLLGVKGVVVSNHVYPGTATCDWLPAMSQEASAHPRAAVLEFSGNTLTTCMRGCPPESASAVQRYCTDLEKAIEDFLSAGTKVFLVGTPVTYTQWMNHDPRRNDLNQAMKGLAAEHGHEVTYIDAGRAVEGADGAFAWTLPCLVAEPCDGPVVGGVRTNVVRAPDGVHFCPLLADFALGCGSYNSGAYRFADAIAVPVLAALGR